MTKHKSNDSTHKVQWTTEGILCSTLDCEINEHTKELIAKINSKNGISKRNERRKKLKGVVHD